MLRVNNIHSFYGDLHVIQGVTFEVRSGETVAIVGPNGAGKSTILKTISGLIEPRSGYIEFMGERIDRVPPHKRVDLGIVQVPEGRLLFPELTVWENLDLGAYSKHARKQKDAMLKHVFQLFPILEERRNQLAGTLSGGEQQMLAIGRALMSAPKLLMFDEPSLGLAPMLVSRVFETVVELKREKNTMLLVEQNVREALEIADRAYLLESGRVLKEGRGKELLQDEYLKKAYLGL